MFDYEQKVQREGEIARYEERKETAARVCPPSVVLPLKPDLRDELDRRFSRCQGGPPYHGLVVVEKATGVRAVFDYTVRGSFAATCWMVARLGVAGVTAVLGGSVVGEHVEKTGDAA